MSPADYQTLQAQLFQGNMGGIQQHYHVGGVQNYQQIVPSEFSQSNQQSMLHLPLSSAAHFDHSGFRSKKYSHVSIA
jgi:hypothetical protein